ncbi:hypothetical protein K9M47_00135 [Candidatus Gracilibacteria bacterium]|nr:hypothetical protein [Candidatus Gracilibacteria bacterium]MCF7898385.1 hypothetical protein [Candidatus Paceibacterota bacterium]
MEQFGNNSVESLEMLTIPGVDGQISRQEAEIEAQEGKVGNIFVGNDFTLKKVEEMRVTARKFKSDIFASDIELDSYLKEVVDPIERKVLIRDFLKKEKEGKENGGK